MSVGKQFFAGYSDTYGSINFYANITIIFMHSMWIDNYKILHFWAVIYYYYLAINIGSLAKELFFFSFDRFSTPTYKTYQLRGRKLNSLYPIFQVPKLLRTNHLIDVIFSHSPYLRRNNWRTYEDSCHHTYRFLFTATLPKFLLSSWVLTWNYKIYRQRS